MGSFLSGERLAIQRQIYSHYTEIFLVRRGICCHGNRYTYISRNCAFDVLMSFPDRYHDQFIFFGDALEGRGEDNSIANPEDSCQNSSNQDDSRIGGIEELPDGHSEVRSETLSWRFFVRGHYLP